jgi:hypothetical protein
MVAVTEALKLSVWLPRMAPINGMVRGKSL